MISKIQVLDSPRCAILLQDIKDSKKWFFGNIKILTLARITKNIQQISRIFRIDFLFIGICLGFKITKTISGSQRFFEMSPCRFSVFVFLKRSLAPIVLDPPKLIVILMPRPFPQCPNIDRQRFPTPTLFKIQKQTNPRKVIFRKIIFACFVDVS